MKSIILLLLVAFCSTPLLCLDYNKKYSPETHTFLHRRSLAAKKVTTKSNYFLENRNSIEYTKVFVKVTPDYSAALLKSLNAKEILRTKTIVLLTLPIDRIPELAALNSIEKIELASPVATPLLDSTLSMSQIKQVHSGSSLAQPYTGAGVIVGVVDYGFDFTHPMFSDANGNSRVVRAWLPADGSGTPPEFSEYGSIYSDPVTIKTTLKYSSKHLYHGSHVLGIAAGSKVKTVNTKQHYSGVAPNADIAVVEIGGGLISINEALYYLLSFADSVDKPLVVNMSLGSTGGPCDGKSLSEQQISEMLTTNPAGRILVVSAGNSGRTNLHIQHQFTGDDEQVNVYQQFKPGENDKDVNYAYFDVWGQSGDKFKIEISISEDESHPNWLPVVDVITTAREPYAGYISACFPYLIAYNIYVDSTYEGNGKPYIRAFFEDHSAITTDQSLECLPWKLRYKITSLDGTDAAIHCWNGLRYNVLWSDELQPDSYYSINSPGTVAEAITVGAFISRDTLHTLTHGDWPNVEGSLHNIANFSSKGPLTDGSLKPDIVAPGSLIYSAYNNYDTTDSHRKVANLVDYVEDNATNNQHIIYWSQGTSMSGPVVAGVVALMLELNPELTQAEIKDILRITAINDDFTGNAKEDKSVVWGWGKVNAWGIMKRLDPTDIKEDTEIDVTLLPNPMDGQISITVPPANAMPYVINIYDSAGKLVWLSAITDSKQADLSHLPTGMYYIEIHNDKAKTVRKIVKL